MSYHGWKPYVPVAVRRAKAAKAAAKAHKAGAGHRPIAAFRGAPGKTFWGKAWCANLERYSDYANRLPRGRSYVRSGSVIDLHIARGAVQAQVMGSRLYRVEITVKPVASAHWKRISADCAGSIDTLVELLQGRLSKAVMEHICAPGTGLFPAPREIAFNCSCPDWASMCKHVAAVLYGIGTRLDTQPEWLFTLRGVDAEELIAGAGAGLDRPAPLADAGKRLDTSALGDVFGIELAGAPVNATRRKTKAKTTAARGVVARTRANAKPTTKRAAATVAPATGKRTKS